MRNLCIRPASSSRGHETGSATSKSDQQFNVSFGHQHRSYVRAILFAGLLFAVFATPAFALADLVVTAASGTCKNNALDINITVRNLGTSTAGTFRVGVYASSNNFISTGDILIANATRSGLAPGASTQISGTISVSNVNQGSYYIGAIADDLDQIVETDEANNWLAGNVIDLPCMFGEPDIGISRLNLTFTESGTKSLGEYHGSAQDDGDPRALLLTNRTIVTSDPGVKQTVTLTAGYQIVQFEALPGPDVVQNFAADGIQVLHFVPRNALMLWVPENMEGAEIEGAVWSGELLPIDKMSQAGTKAADWQHLLVHVFDNVDRATAAAALEGAGALIVENDYVRETTFLVQGDQTVAYALAELDLVNWVEPAPDRVVQGEPFYICPGVDTPYGPMPKYVLRGDGWDGPGLGSADLKYFFVNGTADVPGTNEYPQVQRALAEWARYVDVKFAQTSWAGQTRTIDIRWATGDHGDGTPFDGLAGILAHAFYPAGAGVEPLAGDLHFDDAEMWGIAPTPNLDVFTIALHELGHTLGLNHSTDPNAVMYGLIYPSTVYTGLRPDDIAGIQQLYAAAAPDDAFNVTNSGTNNLTVTSIVPETSAPWLSVSPAPPFSVAPGNVLPVRVLVNYSLAPAGTTTRRLLVHSNDPDESPYPGGVNVTVTASGQGVAPSVTIGAPSVTSTKSGPITFPVTYTNASSVSLTTNHVTLYKTGTANGTVSVSGTGTTSRTVTVNNVTGNGYLSIGIAAGSASNGAGSAPAAGPSNSVAVDNTPPSVSIGTPSALSTSSGPVSYTISYSGASSVSLSSQHINLIRTGTANGTVSVSGTGTTSRTVMINNITGDGTLAISVAAGTASDAVGNLAPAVGPSVSFLVTNVVDNPVGISVGPPSTYSTSSGPVSYTVSYTNATSISLSPSHVDLRKTGSANGTVTVSGSGTTHRTVTISNITGNGTLSIYINPGSASNSTFSAPGAGPSNAFDVTNPTAPQAEPISVHLGPPSTYSTSTGPVSYTLTYTNASEITLSPSYITLKKTGSADGTVSISGSGTKTRVVTISNITGNGTLGIHVSPGSATNGQYTAPSAGPSNSFNVTNTTTPPVDLSVSSPSVAATSNGPVSYTVSYTNATSVVLNAGHIALNRSGNANGTVSVSGSGTSSRTVTISNITGSGSLSISIAAGTASNGSSSAPAFGPSQAVNVSNEPVTLHVGPPSTYSAWSGPVYYTLTYGNASTITLSPSDITLNRTGSADAVVSVTTLNSTQRRVTLSNITGAGTLGIYVKSGTASNVAGFTAPSGGPSNTFKVQNSGIGVSISPPSVSTTSNGPVHYTVTYTGASTISLSPSDVQLVTTGTANGSVSVSGTGNVQRTVTINQITGNGTIGIVVAPGTASSITAEGAPGYGPSNTFSVVNAEIGLHVGPPSTYATVSGPVSYLITYSNADSINLTPQHVSLRTTGSATGTVRIESASASQRRVVIENTTGVGTIGIYIEPGSATNVSGGVAAGGGPSNAFSVDNGSGNTGPVTIHVGPPSTYSTTTGPVTYTITYSGADTITLSPADVSLRTTGTAQGVVSVLTLNATKRQVQIANITGDGTIGIWIAPGTATNAGGKSAPGGGPSNSFSVKGPGSIVVQDPNAEATLLGSVFAMDVSTGLAMPVTCAAVRIWSGGVLLETAVTDIDGAFYGDALTYGASYDLEVMSPGYQPQLLEGIELNSVGQFQEIFMTPDPAEAELWGSVLTADGVPIGGALVSLQQGGAEIAQTVTCASGEFQFVGLGDVADTVELVVAADGFEVAQSSASIAAKRSIEFTLVPNSTAGTVSGRVVDVETGAAVSTATVSVRAVGGTTTLTSATGGNGGYAVDIPATGDYRIHATAAEYNSLTERVTLEGASQNVDLELTPREPGDLLPRDGVSPGCSGVYGASGMPGADAAIIAMVLAGLLFLGRRRQASE